RYQRDPGLVDPATRSFFESWTPASAGIASEAGFGEAGLSRRSGEFAEARLPAVAASEARDPRRLVGAINLAQSIRLYGHRAAGSDRSDRAARSAHAGRSLRAVPPAYLSRKNEVLHRGARHARADSR